MAALLSAAFISFVWHYAIDAPQQLDWDRVPLVHSVIHSHISAAAFWAQDNESRVLVPNLVYSIVGLIDHLDFRTILILDAVLFAGTFWLFLSLFRIYSERRLGTVVVLALGAIWFSLADVENPLVPIMLTWYLLLAMFVLMCWLLHVPQTKRDLCFGLAILCAITASVSVIQGFLLWPVGLISLVWEAPRKRRNLSEVAIWVVVGLFTLIVVVIGYRFGQTGCEPGVCTAGAALRHPVSALQFLLVLVGNVFPSGFHTSASRSLLPKEVLGLFIVVVALAVIGLSLRDRRAGLRRGVPLPTLILALALLWDLMIVIGRAGLGTQAVEANNRWVMPSLLVLLGIATYVFGRVPEIRLAWNGNGRSMAQLAAVLLGCLLAFQVIFATGFGITNAERVRARQSMEARVVANLDRLTTLVAENDLDRVVYKCSFPPSYVIAELSPEIADLRTDRLSVFQPGSFGLLRAEGSPHLPNC